jgi:DHA2 family multidrug resistance protein-like MFS transporter
MIAMPVSKSNRVYWPAVLAVQLGITIVTLDISLTSTALPTIAPGIGVDAATTIWIVNVYFVCVLAALLPLAALGEIFGHRRIFFSGLLVFAVGALICGLSSSLPTLCLGRAIVGFGTAAVSGTAPALIRAIYPAEKLAQGLGLYALVVGVAFTTGPTATSVVLALADWPWLFFTSVPTALVACALAARGLPQTERNVRPFDGISAVLCAATFTLILLGIAGITRIAAQWVMLAFVTGAALGYALLRWESTRPAPILAVDLFRLPLFSLSSATSVCSFVIQGLVLVALPFLFHSVMGYSQVEAGLLITPWPAALALMPLVAAPLANRIAPGLLGGVGLIVLACGLVSLAILPLDASKLEISLRLAFCGVGFGLFQSPNMLALLSSAPRNRSGGASGILAASRLFGQAIGASVVAICLTLDPAKGVLSAIWVGAGFAVLGSAFSLLRLLPRFRAT